MNSELTKNEAANNIFVAYTQAFRNYFNFKGRTCRYDYWGFCFINLLLLLLFRVMSAIIPQLVVLYFLYSLLMLIPGIAVFVRRLHDVNKSFLKCAILPSVLAIFILFLLLIGCAFLLKLSPDVISFSCAVLAMMYWLVWGIVILVFVCRKGNPEDNKYGQAIVESESHDKRAKRLIFLFVLMFVLLMILQIFYAVIGGKDRYDRAIKVQTFERIQKEMDNQEREEDIKIKDENIYKVPLIKVPTKQTAEE